MGISENIKEIRRKYSLTQQQLGEIAGVSDKAVSTWESGTAEPRMGAIQKIAEHFNIPMSEIVDEQPARFRLSTEEQSLVQIYRALDSDGKKALSSYAVFLASSSSGSSEQYTERKHENQAG